MMSTSKPAGLKVYVEKPVRIEAVQFTRDNGYSICEWADNTYLVPEGYDHHLRRANEYDSSNGHILKLSPKFLVIRTLEGAMRADLGDFVIKIYPCKPDIFEESYNTEDIEQMSVRTSHPRVDAHG